MLEKTIFSAIDAGEKRQVLERKFLNAIDAGEEDVVEQIIAAGVKVDFDFNSPICRAALAGHVDIVHRLHVAGCRIDVPGVGSKVLKFAVWGNHPEVIDYLLEQGVRPPLKGKPLLKIAAEEEAQTPSKNWPTSVRVWMTLRKTSSNRQKKAARNASSGGCSSRTKSSVNWRSPTHQSRFPSRLPPNSSFLERSARVRQNQGSQEELLNVDI